MTEKQGGKIAHLLKGDEVRRRVDEETRGKILSLAEGLSLNSYEASDVIGYLEEIGDWLADGHAQCAPKLAMVLKERISKKL